MIVYLIKLLIYWIIGIILSLYIHELGHLLVGLFKGWRLFLFVVGPMKVYREEINGPVKVGFETNIMNWFGIGATVPPDKNAENLKTWGKILLGGPLCSIFSGAAFLLLAFFFRSFFCLMAGMVSLAIGIINLIPLSVRTGLYYNDGTRYGRIKSGGIEAKEEAEIMNIIEKGVVCGENFRLTENECEALIKSQDPIYQYYGYYMLYYSESKYDVDVAKRYYTEAEKLSGTVSKSVTRMFPLDDKVKR